MCRAKLRVMTFGVQTVLLHRIESPHAAALCQLPIHVRTATARRDRRECYNVACQCCMSRGGLADVFRLFKTGNSATRIYYIIETGTSEDPHRM